MWVPPDLESGYSGMYQSATGPHGLSAVPAVRREGHCDRLQRLHYTVSSGGRSLVVVYDRLGLCMYMYIQYIIIGSFFHM